MTKKSKIQDLPQSQQDRRLYLIRQLLAENNKFAGDQDDIPTDENTQREILRSLMNVRQPKPASRDFLTVQDAYLQEILNERGLTSIDALLPVADDLYVWQGDPTTLIVDALVNPAADNLLGCFQPLHDCVDNLIHTYAGIQLRLECASIINQQGKLETPGQAKVTDAYNLPCRYVIHTVGPILRSTEPNQEEIEALASCYRSCMQAATDKGLESIAFTPISRGQAGFPAEQAARIAITTVKDFKANNDNAPKVLFCVFDDDDHRLYHSLIVGKRA